MATINLQDADKDTFVSNASKNTNYGSATYINAGDRLDNETRGIIEFVLTGLPAGATISSATLSLYYYYYVPPPSWIDPVGKTIMAYKVTRTDWVEAQATWNIYKTANNWSVAGGDYVTSNPAGASSVVPAGYGWMTWDVAALVQEANDASAALELIIRFLNEAQGSNYSAMRFYSAEYTTNPSLQPKLDIVYTVDVSDKWVEVPDITRVLTLDNTTAFTPDADYEPATKKYVDDTGMIWAIVFGA